MASFIFQVALTISFDRVLSMLIFITEEDTFLSNSILAQQKSIRPMSLPSKIGRRFLNIYMLWVCLIWYL